MAIFHKYFYPQNAPNELNDCPLAVYQGVVANNNFTADPHKHRLKEHIFPEPLNSLNQRQLQLMSIPSTLHSTYLRGK